MLLVVVVAIVPNSLFCWILAGVFAVGWICIACGLGDDKPGTKERPRVRIDIPHYYDEDEYECTICGARFHSDSMVCPNCGVRFNWTETDDREFIEEEDEEDWWDELEERDG